MDKQGKKQYFWTGETLTVHMSNIHNTILQRFKGNSALFQKKDAFMSIVSNRSLKTKGGLCKLNIHLYSSCTSINVCIPNVNVLQESHKW